MLKSVAVGVRPTIPEAVSLMGPRQSSSGHNTKVSMLSSNCLQIFSSKSSISRDVRQATSMVQDKLKGFSVAHFQKER